MKAVRLHETGGPEVLQLDEVPTPEAGSVRSWSKRIRSASASPTSWSALRLMGSSSMLNAGSGRRPPGKSRQHIDRRPRYREKLYTNLEGEHPANTRLLGRVGAARKYPVGPDEMAGIAVGDAL